MGHTKENYILMLTLFVSITAIISDFMLIKEFVKIVNIL